MKRWAWNIILKHTTEKCRCCRLFCHTCPCQSSSGRHATRCGNIAFWCHLENIKWPNIPGGKVATLGVMWHLWSMFHSDTTWLLDPTDVSACQWWLFPELRRLLFQLRHFPSELEFNPQEGTLSQGKHKATLPVESQPTFRRAYRL
jgi:hypothetical protein